MRQLGTDMLAVACIAGGAVVAGGVTLALANGPERISMECATTVGPDANVMVKLGDQGLVMVTPDVRVRAVKECVEHAAAENRQAETAHAEWTTGARHGEQVEREIERAREEIERARREADRVRERVDRVRGRTDRVRRVRVDGVERVRADASRRALEARERALEARARAKDEARRAEEQRARRTRDELRGVDPEQLRAQLESLELLGGEHLRLEGLLGGLTIDLPDNRSFELHFEGLEDMDFEFEGLGEALELQLRVLEGLELQLDGLDEEAQREIERRIEEELEKVQQRLERIGGDIGR